MVCSFCVKKCVTQEVDNVFQEREESCIIFLIHFLKLFKFFWFAFSSPNSTIEVLHILHVGTRDVC